ncbi:hypothetical protein EHI8A_051880 [Entamoeba histolytica HM-1:IMSS-B]|uniref:Uncharacterized protein n=6 Tax=Entamoeba histolytica TaxID=5759 RepID=C4LUE6_ENTH1|nr:hypothetical protein EHI_049450 [Entamoeba histolytica HM-1:IMSS]EMD45871.1 Hypothetical protein EHI5A_023420 [Entamoeba histolytica KU27]EMH72953.1 hypothetical protein EHI8A_051880 [Entamoeba histolytica HM-1:IMSS-B]EMS13266.1 hypothetical protein KM1_027060 [Entamoeba histolytica HM-3:IMSS]ENY62899.1 hypothetical protein EHI7A_099000 [Entamoeba histolytica HM-1:IMSS-A]GAT92232.1 hypothetical protein CL6EHI_049450 [Entamoeba histolytica]|eukprot:XP_655871.1 hypothetical protein EHI_049450 [Entamoeba histolytica HM-1:IMSS]
MEKKNGVKIVMGEVKKEGESTMLNEVIPRYYNCCMCCHSQLDNPRNYCVFCLSQRVAERGQKIDKQKEEITKIRQHNHEIEKVLSEKLCSMNKETDIVANTNVLFNQIQQNEMAISVIEVKEKDGIRKAIEHMKRINKRLIGMKKAIESTISLEKEYYGMVQETNRLIQLQTFLKEQIVIKKKQQIKRVNEIMMVEIIKGEKGIKKEEEIERPIEGEKKLYKIVNFNIQSNSKMFTTIKTGNLFINYLYLLLKEYTYIIEIPCTLIVISKGNEIPNSIIRKSNLNKSGGNDKITIPTVNLTFSHQIFKIFYDEFQQLYCIQYKTPIEVEGENYVEKIIKLLQYFKSF